MQMVSLNKKKNNLVSNLLITLTATASVGSAMAAEIPTDPGDYVPLPEGTNLGLVYAQYATRDTVYSNGDAAQGGSRLDTITGLARLIHFMDIGGYTVDPQIIIPFADIDFRAPSSNPQSETGIGDPMIGATAWLINNTEQQEWFGLSAFASMPYGSYDADKGPVNAGQNRWKGIFQAGYVKALGDNFMLDVIGEYAVYSDNDDFMGSRREQDDTQSIQTHLRYLLNSQSHIALSYYHDFGGETTVGGVEQNDELNTNRWLATYATFMNPTTQVQFQYGQDIDVSNGFKEDKRFNFRIAKAF